ncbi:hypothetical protein Ssi03_62260 [Sphaerisporangium siamense]|uniref:DNA-binding winged helix-turn-helix (WHTH) protein n=1 Tax=Sphaerisporangium siamense TaxID=795645 RepID=A0A7W7D958_9ACTN|nr:DNA-binding winged helix-turn-helix (wHTH) protein [Sphaerisporangium siamense]GII88236.1 hypothetical protein Ssi03_62260 [Sphaerisporangium siamense]
MDHTPPDDGLIRVDEATYRAWKGAQELQLPLKVYLLLAALVSHAGRVVTREELMSQVWNTSWAGSTKTIDMHMSWLRRALGDDPSAPRYITTVRGVGFLFEADAVPPPALTALEVKTFRLPLRIDRHGQTIYDANDVLVAAAMSPQAARWIVQRANENHMVEAVAADA